MEKGLEAANSQDRSLRKALQKHIADRAVQVNNSDDPNQNQTTSSINECLLGISGRQA